MTYIQEGKFTFPFCNKAMDFPNDYKPLNI
nr:MAG TPA: 60S ribosomal subunit [Caudoviricetes sp.]